MAELNQWSKGKTIRIPVVDFYMNPREVVYKNKKILVGDYELFTGMINSWAKGDRYAKPMDKREALELAFEMA